MSLITQGEKLVVEVKSALDEALGSMPDQAMKADDIANGVKSRSTQELERSQSGFNEEIARRAQEGMTFKPKEIREFVAANRTDNYKVSEIRGIPDKPLTPATYPQEDVSEFNNIADRLGLNGEGRTPLNMTEDNVQNMRTIADDRGDIDAVMWLDVVLQDNIVPTNPSRDRMNAIGDSIGRFGPFDATTQAEMLSELEVGIDEAVSNQYFGQAERLRAEFNELDALFTPNRAENLTQFRNIVRNIGDDAGAIDNWESFEPYVQQLEQGIDEGSVRLGEDISTTEYNNLRDLAGMEPIPRNTQINFTPDQAVQVEDFLDNLDLLDSIPSTMDGLRELEASYAANPPPNGGTDFMLEELRQLIREVSATQYNFDMRAYRNYSMPDTDDASYFVRIYENPAVDRKGLDYGDSKGHWAGKYQDGVFHVRGDDMGPDVRRLQEVQSDIQNVLSDEKRIAIDNWKSGPIIMPDANNVISVVSSEGKLVKSMREETNTIIQGDINSALGKDYDMVAFYGVQPGEMSIGDISNYLANKVLVNDNITELEALSGEAQRVVNYLSRGESSYIRPGNVRAELLKASGLTEVEFNTTLDIMKSLYNDYYAVANTVANKTISGVAEAKKLRVTKQERESRILNDSNISLTKEELELRRSAIKTRIDWLNQKYNIDISPLDVKMPIDLYKATVERILKVNSIEDVIGDIAQTAIPGGDASLNAGVNYIAGEVRNFTSAGIDFIREAYPEVPTHSVLRLQVLETLNDITGGIKDLTPLEKFPNADDFNIPVPWRKQAYQSEIVQAIKDGKKEVWLTVNPDGVKKLVRNQEFVQAEYESGNMYKQFKSMARRFKATIKEEDGYLKLILPAAGVLSMSAYAEPNNQDFRVQAFENGFAPGEVDSYLMDEPIEEIETPLWEEQALNEGYTQQDITQYKFEEWVKELKGFQEPNPERLIESDVPTVSGDAVYSKLTNDEVKELAVELGVNPTTPSGIDTIYKTALERSNPAVYNAAYNKDENLIKNDVADFIELYDVDRPFLWAQSKLGYPDAMAAYEQFAQEAAANVIAIGKEHGYDLILGDGISVEKGGSGLAADEWYVDNGKGQLEVATPGFMATMARYIGEGVGGVAGGTAGLQKAAQFGATADPFLQSWPGGRVVSTLAKFGIISAYTAAGTMLGDQVDYASAAIRQNESMNFQVAGDKLLGSAEMSVVFDVAAVPIGAVAKFGWKKVSHAYNEFANGNIDAAYEMLKDTTGLTDDQIEEIIGRWKRLNLGKDNAALIDQKPERKFLGATIPGKSKVLNPKEEAIAVIPVTKAGGENIVAAVGQIDARASVITARQVSKRAEDLLQETGERVADATSSGDVLAAVQTNIDNYRIDTNTFYDQTRTMGNDLVEDGYQFNINSVAIDPLQQGLERSLEDPAKIARAAAMIEKISKLVKSRTFDDLIELRQTINNLRGVGKLNNAAVDAFNETLGAIDGEINRVMSITDGGSEWLKQWEEARLAYGEMKDVTNSALVKALTIKGKGGKLVPKPGIGPKQAAKLFVKYGVATGDTYQQVMKQLDHKTWTQVETNMVDLVTNKWTVGQEGEFRAIQFPELDKELSQYKFLTNEARELQQAIARLAEVYTNDVNLSFISGGIKLTSPSQGLSKNLHEKAQYSFMAKVWSNISRYIGTKNANTQSLVHKAAQFLENPLDAATVKQAIKAAKGDTELLKAIDEMQALAAAEVHAGRGTIKITTYKNKAGQHFTQPIEGAVPAEAIPRHRITTDEQLAKLGMDPENLSVIDKRMLQNKGYKAVALEDGRLIIFN